MTPLKVAQFLNRLPLSVTQRNKIYMSSPYFSELWVTKRGQNDDITLKSYYRVIITPAIT